MKDYRDQLLHYKHMEKLLLIALLVSVLLFAACTSDKKTDFKPSPSDTIKTLAIYKNTDTSVRYDILYRVSKDSLMVAPFDTTLKQWARHIQYFVPVYDSTGKILGYPQMNTAALVRDMNISIDSLVNALPNGNKPK